MGAVDAPTGTRRQALIEAEAVLHQVLCVRGLPELCDSLSTIGSQAWALLAMRVLATFASPLTGCGYSRTCWSPEVRTALLSCWDNTGPDGSSRRNSDAWKED